MKTTFNWGILGPGRIAKKFAEAANGTQGTHIYAVASRSGADAEALKRTYGAQVVYKTYEELAADPKVDAIYISTPHRFHFENIKLCLHAGKPVLCEKPLTVNSRQAEEVIKLSKSKDLFLMEALWTRFLPIYDQVREWLDAGEIGDIRLAQSTFGYVAPRELDDRLLNPKLAGGTLLDIGVYNTAITQWAFQMNPLTATAVGYLGETGVDEQISVIFTYDEGAAAQFSCTFQAEPSNQFEIFGTDGNILIGPNFWEATQAALIKGGKTKTEKKRNVVNGFEYQIMAAVQAIQDEKLDCPQMTQADTLANMRTMDAIRRQIGLKYPFE